MYYSLPLYQYYNNKGFTYLTEQSEQRIGNFTTFGSSYPGEELPDQTSVMIEQIPFLFPDAQSVVNNIELENQSLGVPHHRYTGMYVLGAADNGSYEEDIQYFSNHTLMSTVSLNLTNWTDEHSRYHEQVAFRCSGICTQKGSLLTSKPTTIWLQRLLFEHAIDIDTIVLPDNPCMHIFSITLQKENTDEHATT